MNHSRYTIHVLLGLGLFTLLSACGKDEPVDTKPNDDIVVQTDVKMTAADAQEPSSTAVIGASEIPYPAYPNGEKYRVGGENGLKIVLFQTEDAFEDVDEFYSQLSEDGGMPRLKAMSDYVRYSTRLDDMDPWGTDQPGIVIHQFNEIDEIEAVGASETAKTNIIMSY